MKKIHTIDKHGYVHVEHPRPHHTTHHHSEHTHHPKKHHKIDLSEKKKPKKTILQELDDFVFLIVILAIIYYVVQQGYLATFMQSHPWLWAVYQYIHQLAAEKSLLGLFFATFFGGLFFITMPIEVTFLYFLSLGYNVPLIILIALAGDTLGLIVDYSIGWLLGKRVLRFFLKDTYDKFINIIERFGGVIILFGNIIPFPIQLVSLVIGTTRYSIKKFVIYSAIGKLIKLVILAFAGNYILNILIPYIKDYALNILQYII